MTISILFTFTLFIFQLCHCAQQQKVPSSPFLSDVDANAIIEPFLRPFSHMYDMMQENHKALTYAEKIEQRRKESPLSRSKGLFDLIDALQETTTTTTTVSPLRQLLAPYIDPFERGAKMLEQDMKDLGIIPTTPTTTTTPKPTTTPSILEKSFDLLFNAKENEDGEVQPGLFQSMIQMMSQGAVQSFSQDNFRAKRRVKRQSSPFDLFDNLLGFNNPVSLSNPFTPNPLVSLFTTPKPMTLPTVEPSTSRPHGLPNLQFPSLADPQFRIQDPFYNPLQPKRKNKFWELLDSIDRENKKMMKNMKKSFS